MRKHNSQNALQPVGYMVRQLQVSEHSNQSFNVAVLTSHGRTIRIYSEGQVKDFALFFFAV